MTEDTSSKKNIQKVLDPNELEDASVESKIVYGEGIKLTRRLLISIRPEITIAWEIDYQLLPKRFTLNVFHNTTGFCAERQPANLASHGELVAESTHDDSYTTYPPEGVHYFTILLWKPFVYGPWMQQRSEPIRIAIEVPSAKVVMARLKDRQALQDLFQKQKISPILYGTEEYKAMRDRALAERAYTNATRDIPIQENVQDPDISHANKKLERDARLRAAMNQKLRELEESPEYKSLDGPAKERRRREIISAFSPGEHNARREALGE